MKITRNASTILSLWATALCAVAVVALALFLPRLCAFYLRGDDTQYYAFALSILYSALTVGAAAVAALFLLLIEVRQGHIFTRPPVRYLRLLSWCCMAEGALFAVLGLYFYFSFAIAAASLILGLILRVVKNCVEEAVAIKEENDFTI